MNKFEDLETWSPKRLRTLRNNLNNRISAFKAGGKSPELQKSHKLFEMEQSECEDLLIKVQRLLKDLKNQ